MGFGARVGERLREVRTGRGWSLQDVERISDGAWKAAVVGSYERGDRNITASRLLALAEFYGVAPSAVLPPDGGPVRDPDGALVIDLVALRGDDHGWPGVRRYAESIRGQRGDYNNRMLSVRTDDLRALAIIEDRDPDELVEALQDAGIVRTSD